MANRNEMHTRVETYTAEVAAVKYGFVKQGTAADGCILPTAATDQALGIALDDAAIGERVPVLIEGSTWVIDMDGTLNTGDAVSVGDGAAEYHKATIAASTNPVTGVVVGEDAGSADDLVLVQITAGYKPILA